MTTDNTEQIIAPTPATTTTTSDESTPMTNLKRKVEETSDTTTVPLVAAAVPERTPTPSTTDESIPKKVKLDGEEHTTATVDCAVAPSAEKVTEEMKTDEVCENDAGMEVEDDADEVSIYPDVTEFYAWFVTGESGPFLACHRIDRMDVAIPAARTLLEKNITSIVDVETKMNTETNSGAEMAVDGEKKEECEEKKDEVAAATTTAEKTKEEEELEDMKEMVNEAIDEAYCITLMDAGHVFVEPPVVDAMPAADEKGEESKTETATTTEETAPKPVETAAATEDEKKEEPTAEKPVVEESEACKALRAMVAKAEQDKTWIRIKIAREADEKSGFVPITVADMDPRQGLIIPKIACWKYIVEVEPVEASVNEGLKMVME
ncbi:hypothetical protein HDU76_004648, partial [Blyttiomyces sp. JEL0837]